ncbi:major facilitator superfamily domain-containing protein [Kickxella alabastrina]|uniref:major facilitator superfamily domain-containing protein n=1 Tax=Kickxella alabastrina TaxID=61397 RepID=UPI00221FCE60|nr:major facilitator superfamily domain-containing protein [Kickxella alabastrina]KAI7823100.1 major facilitator superfamily domain-containing protein [Kickxella alabastrina]
MKESDRFQRLNNNDSAPNEKLLVSPEDANEAAESPSFAEQGIGQTLSASLALEEARRPRQLKSFGQYFGEWKHMKVLLGTSIAWFALDVAFYGINLNSSIVIGAIGFAGNISTDKPSKFIIRNCLGNIIINISDPIGRKKIQLIGFGALTILYLILGFGYHQILGKSSGAFIFLFSLAQLFQNFGPNVTTFVIPGEVFPTRFRSTAHGIAAASGKLGAIVAQGGFLQLTDIGGKNAWINRLLQIFGLFMMIGFVVTFWIPETKGKTLEEICDESEEYI